MSRRGNCWDNAVAESFFSSLKTEQIKKRIYAARAQAKSETSITSRVSTIALGATSTSTNSAPMSSKSSVKLLYEK
jgi:transposase InsO family protein